MLLLVQNFVLSIVLFLVQIFVLSIVLLLVQSFVLSIVLFLVQNFVLSIVLFLVQNFVLSIVLLLVQNLVLSIVLLLVQNFVLSIVLLLVQNFVLSIALLQSDLQDLGFSPSFLLRSSHRSMTAGEFGVQDFPASFLLRVTAAIFDGHSRGREGHLASKISRISGKLPAAKSSPLHEGCKLRVTILTGQGRLTFKISKISAKLPRAKLCKLCCATGLLVLSFVHAAAAPALTRLHMPTREFSPMRRARVRLRAHSAHVCAAQRPCIHSFLHPHPRACPPVPARVCYCMSLFALFTFIESYQLSVSE